MSRFDEREVGGEKEDRRRRSSLSCLPVTAGTCASSPSPVHSSACQEPAQQEGPGLWCCVASPAWECCGHATGAGERRLSEP